MRALTDLSPRLEFTRRAAITREQERRLAEKQATSELQEEKERDLEKRNEEEFFELMQVAIVLASDTQIEAFALELDRHDAATVEALMENEREMKVIQERIEKRLAQAVVLQDGRRVFKTEDGTHVFDEFGVEVSPDVISPDEIPDHKDRFEPYWADRRDEAAHAKERKELLEYQKTLDDVRDRFGEAREKTGKDALTQDQFEDLGAEIDAATPERVQTILRGQSVRLDNLASDPTTEERDLASSMVLTASKPSVFGFNS